MMMPSTSLAQIAHNDSLHSLGVNFNAANPVVLNMGANLGYPSIINNNIQGLSINYSNIIQQAPGGDYAHQAANAIPMGQMYQQ